MIQLFGLRGYLGCDLAPPWLVEEQTLYWGAKQQAEAEIAKRQAEAMKT